MVLALALPQAASADLASGKPVTASSIQDGDAQYAAGFANDGNTSTRWSSTFDDNQWWQVDLGTAQQVSQVSVNWEAAYASHYQVQVSTDGNNFTTVADVTNTAAGLKTTTFTAVSARYVRILGLTRGTQYGFSIWEVQVVGPGTASNGLPDRFSDSTVWSGLNQPIAVRFAPFPDQRVFVAEKSGIIKEFDNLQDQTPTQVADLSRSVYNFWDEGLLGLTVDPGFPARPYIYVSYTYDAAIGGTAPQWGGTSASDPCPNPPGATDQGCVVSGRLSKLTIDPLTNQMTSEQVLINDWCQQFPSHSVGDVHFGADGALYMSGGEGASFNYADYGQTGNPCNDPPGGTMTLPTGQGGDLRSQSIRRPSGPVLLSGTVIRVDPDTGLGKADNPIPATSGTNAHRIVAAGLRNPFRFTFRPGMNDLWIGDVGSGNYEEINRDTAPTAAMQNYGWPCYEGPITYGLSSANVCTGLSNTQGYYAYNHASRLVTSDPCPTSKGSSISGIAFYGSGSYPSSYNGALFFADHTRNCIWVARAGSDGLPEMSTLAPFYTAQTTRPVDLQTGPGGDLFYVSHENGTVNRISYAATNQPPTARISTDVTSGDAPLTVRFDGTGSSDPDTNDTLSYSWDLDGNGSFGDSTAAKPAFTYTTPGVYTAALRVSDPLGHTDTTTVKITVSQHPPTAAIDTPAATLTWKVGDTINFSGHASDPDEGTLPASDLTWHLIIHHCPTDPNNCHTHAIQDFSGVASGSFTAPDHSYPSWIELQLVAKDATGLTDTKSVRLDPQTEVLGFDAIPSGMPLTVNGDSSTTPFNRTVIVGSNNSVTALTPQTLGGSSYDFSSWSDGGAASHNLIAGATSSYTATYFDTTAPSSSATAPAATNSTSIEVDYSADGTGSALDHVDLYAKGPSDSSYTKVDTDSSPATTGHNFTYTASEGEGSYAFYTLAYDKAGNVEPAPANTAATTQLDTQKPSSSATAPAASNSSSIEVDYTASDNAGGSGLGSVDFYVKGPLDLAYSKADADSSPATSGHHFTYTPSEGDGSYSYYTIATDKAGNTEDAPAFPDATSVAVDTAKPTSSATSPTYANSTSIEVDYSADGTGSALDHVDLYAKGPSDSSYTKVDTDSSPATTGHHFTYTASEGEGSYAFYTLAYDKAGNVEPAPASPDATTTLATNGPAVSIASPTDGQALVEGAHKQVAYSCSDPGGPEVASCDGAMPDHAMVDTAKPGKHSFTVSATDKAGNRTTKTVHYMVLSAGKLTISGPVKAFRRNGKWWIDTGIRAACPGTGPACAAVLHSHRQLAAARVGRANVSIAGGKSRELEFELGPGRLAALDQGGTIQVKIDAKLSRGTSHLVRLTRPADVKPTP